MHTPKSPNGDEDFSPEDENDELIPQYNPGTTERPMMDEAEWLAQFSFIEIPTIFNPVTSDILRDEGD